MRAFAYNKVVTHMDKKPMKHGHPQYDTDKATPVIIWKLNELKVITNVVVCVGVQHGHNIFQKCLYYIEKNSRYYGFKKYTFCDSKAEDSI